LEFSRFARGEDCEIASTARINEGVVLGNHVRIGDWALIEKGVTIEDDCFIGPHVIVGEPTRDYYKDPKRYEPKATTIGAGSIIRANSCIYSGVVIGKGFECGSFVSIREETIIGDRCSVGTYGDIQGKCSIGDDCRFHCSVHVTQYSSIGSFVWMFAKVLMLNAPVAPLPPGLELKGPKVGDYCVILSNSVLFPGVTLGMHVVVAANSKVAKDVPDWMMVGGDPAREICDSRKFFYLDGDKIIRPYPWMVHRKDNYPWKDEIPPEWSL